MPTLIALEQSRRKGKKLKAVFRLDTGRTKTIHFGAIGYEDFTTHKDEARKQRYIERHRSRESFNEPMTAGALSRWILWNKPTIIASVMDFKKRFHV